MSLIYKCDICGKDSAMSGVDFSNEPVVLKMKTYDNKIMNITMTVFVEDVEDTKNINKMGSMINGFIMNKSLQGEFEGNPSQDDIYQEAIYDNMDKLFQEFSGKLTLTNNTVGLKLETPNPMICDHCKKEAAQRILTESVIKKQKHKSYSTSSKRLSDNELLTTEGLDEMLKELTKSSNSTKLDPPPKPEKCKKYCKNCQSKISRNNKSGLCRKCWLNKNKK